MGTPQKIALFVLSILLVMSIASCAVHVKHDNGKHKGWYKKNNAVVINSGKSNSNSHGNVKGNSGKAHSKN